MVEKAYDKIYKLAYKKAKEIYGESLPYLIAERLEKELLFIKKYNYVGYYLLAYKAVSYIRQSGEYVTNRDYSSVLVAFLLGINTAIHYRHTIIVLIVIMFILIIRKLTDLISLIKYARYAVEA